MVKYGHFMFRIPADRPLISRLVALLIGAAMTAAFAPLGLWFLAPVLVLPLLYIFLTVSPRDAAGHMFWFGLGLFLTGTYWIYISVHVYGRADEWIAFVLMIGLALIMSSFLWLAGWLASRLSQGETWILMLVGPSAWVCVEWLRGWVLTGFPWLALGYGQIDSPLSGWAPVLGVYGVSFMLVLSAAAALVMVMHRGALRILGFVLCVSPWVAGGVLTLVDWTEPAGPVVRASVVQAGVGQDQKWNGDQLRPIMDFYRSSTLSVAESRIVVWPEVAIPSVQDRVEPFIEVVEAEARDSGQAVFFGILERRADQDGENQVFNSLFLVGTAERQVYRKRHLVPFGEYFPVPAGVREWMKMQNLPYADLAAGKDEQPLFELSGGLMLAAAICYEDAYPAEMAYAYPDANILVNVSNDAWFGRSIAPHQHLEIARMRSLESGRPTVRSTNTGISAFIGPKGELLAVGRQFVPEIMTADIEPRRGDTPYTSAGNWPILGLCFAILGIFWIRNRASL